MSTRKTTTKGAVPPYGPPIREAIARGDIQEMRAVAKSARAWLKDVEKALQQLDRRIEKLGAK
jgi:phytoene/squalene synthetase